MLHGGSVQIQHFFDFALQADEKTTMKTNKVEAEHAYTEIDVNNGENRKKLFFVVFVCLFGMVLNWKRLNQYQ